MPDVLVEVRNGTVVGLYSDLPVSAAVLDWDNITEPDGERSFCLIDAAGQPVIGAVVPIPVEPPESMSGEATQAVTFFNRTETDTRAR